MHSVRARVSVCLVLVCRRIFQLLASREEVQCARARRWWFNLYDIIFGPRSALHITLTDVDDEEEDEQGYTLRTSSPFVVTHPFPSLVFLSLGSCGD